MINISYSPNFLLSFIVICAMLIFYSLRTIRPGVSKEEDILFVSFGLLYSCIIFVHGWRLDPILFFSQILLVATVLGIGWENIRLRGLLIKKLEIEDED